MKRQIKTFVAGATLAMTASSTLTADACDRGGRRVSIGRRIGISASPLHRYSPPVYRQPQPVYSQPTYSQPTYSQPTYSQPTYSQPTYSQPTYSQPTYSQPVHSAPPAPAFSNPGISNRVVSSQGSVQARPGMVSREQVSAPPATRPAVTSQSSGQVRQVSGQSTGRPVQPQSQTNTSGNAEASALELLASIGGESNTAKETSSQIPQFSAPQSSQTGSHVGTWKVNLPGNQSVELVLNSDNSFAWTATKGGKSSSFQGQYRLEGARLTLVRSSDLQQMAGSWTGQGTGFAFKLEGATTAGLNFSRS